MRKFWSAALIYLSISGISLMTANAQETAEPMPPSVADQDAETETKPLEPIAETQWPQVFPPLNVLITPRRDRIEPEDDTAQDGPAEWAQVPLANGRQVIC
ncbi:hypothetical protein JCM17844_26560 [Iodidimonas gelatinilytica]|uniref:Uncharacterized protein n=1 Tax=Iodidimonas gelatinilytica TaxID=1236966 RepID=A0A5A7MVV1_9PROT|nr:hypothetical protein [Iodidimonas gelatinilytica]GEQ99019.1 hypothetical protein JCM17844_26560 [Iodidimonas gelatinilytica]